MNEQLADLLRARLVGLPLTDRLVGLARTYETQVANGEDRNGETTYRTVRLPVPVTFTADECDQDSRYLLPDAGSASVLFFEDQGATPGGIVGVADSWRSVLRLIGWVNPAHFEASFTDVTLTSALLKALQIGRRSNEGLFQDLLVTATVLPADATLVGRYTYETPLLYPPYRLVGLELTCVYRLAPQCAAVFPARITPIVC